MYPTVKTFRVLLSRICETKETSITKLWFQKRTIKFLMIEVSEILKKYFIKVTKTLDLKPSIISTNKSVPKIIETFKHHPIIKKIFSLRRE